MQAIWKRNRETEGKDDDDEYGNFMDDDEEEERGEDEEERVWKERSNNSACNNTNSSNCHYGEELVDTDDEYGKFLDEDDNEEEAEAEVVQVWKEGVTSRGHSAHRISPDTDMGIDIDTTIAIDSGRAPRSLAADIMHSSSNSNIHSNKIDHIGGEEEEDDEKRNCSDDEEEEEEEESSVERTSQQ